MIKFIKMIKQTFEPMLCKLNIIFCLRIKNSFLILKAKVNFKLILLVFILTIAVVALGFEHANSVISAASTPVVDSSGLKVKNSEEVIVQKPKDVRIVIDPGHGGEDVGTYYGDIYEKNLNLDISLRFGKLLRQEGINITYTREKDVSVDLIERAKIANDLDATLFISVHNNRMPDEPDYKGTETLYCASGKQEDGKMDGEKLAVIVQKELVKTLKTYDNGIICRPNLAVLHRTKMPAVIAEIAYISNWSDRSNLESGDFRQKAAEALYRATLKALREIGAAKNSEGSWVYLSK